jgi:hypothetical protein
VVEIANRLIGAQSRVVESPHPYLPNTDEELVVSMPGATYLTVTFDERCKCVRACALCALC